MDADVEKYYNIRAEFFHYVGSHPDSTREQIIAGLGWSAVKVDAFIRWGTNILVLTSRQAPNGAITYHEVDFMTALIRQGVRDRLQKELRQRQTLREPVADSSEEEPEKFDIFSFLKEKNLL